MGGTDAMTLPNMEPMSWAELVKNNPEWAAVIVSGVFAAITILVLAWQVFVMIWQGRNSERHERIQNRLIRLQHDHEWLQLLNGERKEILNQVRKLHLRAASIKEAESVGDPITWDELRETAYALHDRLRILDLATYAGEYDQWYPALEEYVEAILKAIIEDGHFNDRYKLMGGSPNLATRKLLAELNERCEPLKISLDLEAAIRMEFFGFKEKWDTLLLS
jgi:hypothetical protein